MDGTAFRQLCERKLFANAPQTLVHLKDKITEEIRRIDKATLEEDDGRLGFSALSIVPCVPPTEVT